MIPRDPHDRDWHPAPGDTATGIAMEMAAVALGGFLLAFAVHWLIA